MTTLLTIPEAAERMRVSESTVRGYIRAGVLDVICLGLTGRRRFIDARDLDRLIETSRRNLRPPRHIMQSATPEPRHGEEQVTGIKRRRAS